jgi:hypothetical protein
MLGHGGKRPGAGRPRKTPVLGPTSSLKQMPLEFLLDTMRDQSVDMKLRVSAAKAALPYFRKANAGAALAPDDARAVRDSFAVILGNKK